MRPVPATRAAYTRFQPVHMRWADTDIYGHMNNAVHYTLFDTVVQAFLTANDLLDLGQSETVFLVVSSGCDYFDEITFGDALLAGLRIARLGTSSVRYDISLFRNDQDIAAATGHFTQVNVSRQTRRATALNPHARATLAKLT